MNILEDLNAVIAVVTMSLVLIGLVVALEHNHRRTAGLPTAPFGSDVADADLARVRRDLVSARKSTAQSSGSSSRASQVAKRSTALSNSGCVSVNS